MKRGIKITDDRKRTVRIELPRKLYQEILKEMFRIADGIKRKQVVKIKPVLSGVRVDYVIDIHKETHEKKKDRGHGLRTASRRSKK